MSAHPESGNGHQRDDIDAARREVARAERQLSSRLGEVTAAGEASVRRAVSLAKPVLLGVAVVVGVAWVVSLWRRPQRRWAPAEPSVLKEAARAAALTLASAAARRVSEHLLQSSNAPQWTSPGRAVPPQSSVSAR